MSTVRKPKRAAIACLGATGLILSIAWVWQAGLFDRNNEERASLSATEGRMWQAEASPWVSEVPAVASPALPLLGADQVYVYGTVTNGRGGALAGVRVAPWDELDRTTRTNADGRYQFYATLGAGEPRYAIEFRARGYGSVLHTFSAARLGDSKDVALDVRLDSGTEATTLSGIVTTRSGEAVPGQTVHLHSRQLNAQYSAVSDASGRFTIPQIKTAWDYRVRAPSGGTYRAVERGPITVAPNRGDLEVVLEPFEWGRLTGSVVDLEGNPVPHFDLWLRSAEAPLAPIQLSSDAEGRFALAEAPRGRVSFQTRAAGPRFEITGVSLPAEDEQAEVYLPLDVGDHAIEGRALDDKGSPIPGAKLKLSWSWQIGELQSSSQREVVADDTGGFRFGELGPGAHRLFVHADRYVGRVETVNVGGSAEEIEIRLTPAARY